MDPSIVKVEAANTDGYLTSTNSDWATAKGAASGGSASGDTDTTSAYLEIKADEGWMRSTANTSVSTSGFSFKEE